MGRKIIIFLAVSTLFLVSGGIFCQQNWKTYRSEKSGFEIKYPKDLITISQEGEKIILLHSIPFEHPNPCYLGGGDPSPLKELIDFKVSLEIFHKNLKKTVLAKGTDYVVSNFLPGDTLKIEPGFIDKVSIGSLKGYRITSGAEGCGIYTYYFALTIDKTLLVVRDFVPELQPVIVDYEKYLKLPGIIPPDKEEKLFNQILSTFRLLE